MKPLIDFDDALVFGIPLTDVVDGTAVREGMLLEGPQGWGEFSPRSDCGNAELARWLTSATEGGTVGWPDPRRGRIPIAVTVPAVTPATAHQIVVESGCLAADVTVGTFDDSLSDDVARIEAVRDALGPGGAVRCVAGGRWVVDTAVAAISALTVAAGELEFVVQPCAAIEDLAAVRRRVDVRIAADVQMLCASDDFDNSIHEIADIAVLRCGPLGGVRRALRLAELAEVPCVVASSVETSIGLASGLALAGALPELAFACGLGTRSLLIGDVVAEPRSLRPVDGFLPVAPSPASPDLLEVERYALTDPDRIAWWRARLDAVRASG
jgi:O-succinylbenzoate synthase